MNIQRKKLIEPVIIPGMNFNGKSSSITFSPYDKPGWWWDTKYNGFVPIDYRIARYKKGRIQLFVPGEVFNILEHLNPLRFDGIDGVAIRMDNNNWPPYYVAAQYLKYFDGKTKKTGEYIPTITVRGDYHYSSSNHLLSEVQIKRSDDFSLFVLSKWEDLPQNGILLDAETLFDKKFLKHVFEAKPQGLSNRKVFAKIWQLFGWPHMKNVAWKSDFDSKEDASYAWWLHAVQDALGEISLASHEALPVGSFFRFKVGHKQMLEGVKKSFS